LQIKTVIASCCDRGLVSATIVTLSPVFKSSVFCSQAEYTSAPAPQPVGQVRERTPLGGFVSPELHKQNK